jgi:hypothetical protein
MKLLIIDVFSMKTEGPALPLHAGILKFSSCGIEKLHSYQPLEWIQNLIVEAPRQRLTASDLFDQIISLVSEQYYGGCCGEHELSDAISCTESEFETEETIMPVNPEVAQPTPIPMIADITSDLLRNSHDALESMSIRDTDRTIKLRPGASTDSSMMQVAAVSKVGLPEHGVLTNDASITTENASMTLTNPDSSKIRTIDPRAAYVEDAEQTIVPTLYPKSATKDKRNSTTARRTRSTDISTLVGQSSLRRGCR